MRSRSLTDMRLPDDKTSLDQVSRSVSATTTILATRLCIKKQKAASIWSDLLEADFWDTILDFGMFRGSEEGIQILPNNTAILVMGVKTRNMHVLDLFKCLRWHTLESLVNYHDYCIVRSGQPANLWLIYVQNKAHQVGYADWMYPNSIDDPQRAMLNEGAVTRQRTMDNIN